ncbi:MAG TPA: hypothetical protein VFS20_09850 [Longimicrobium sp.]|nr:hypothetical protein [Longimicrobium sp.]
MLHRTRSIPLPFFLALVTASSVAAQAQQPVPGDLVRALMRSPEVVVGRAPAGFPSELVPPGGRVLGGVPLGTTGAVLAVEVPQSPDAAGDAAQQALLRAGWTQPGSGAGQARGFVGRPEHQSDFRHFCRGSETVTLSSSAAPGGGSYLRVDYHKTDRPSACSYQTSSRGTDPWRDVPIPTLNVPAGAAVMNTSMGTRGLGGSGGDVGARLRSRMGAHELAASFERQLRSAGWTPSPPASNAEVAAQTFRMRGADGKEWFGVLTAVAHPESEIRDVAFSVNALPVQER